MLILTNCLTPTPDEGSLKVGCCLTRAVKSRCPETKVISYERRSELTDVFLKTNRLLLSRELLRQIRQETEGVLYIPFPTRSLPMALRLFLLSRLSPVPVTAVLSMTRNHGPLSRLLLKYSRGKLAALSRTSADFYGSFVGEDRVLYLKAAVDTAAFTPVSPARARSLKEKYGLDPDRKVLFHAGHLKRGRNLQRLLEFPGHIQLLLAVSSFTRQEEDLRILLEQRENVTLLQGFLPHIEELYQLCDGYVFPVEEKYNCIDVPLSCLEAAACGKPVITTGWGEMAELLGKPGFYPLTRWEAALEDRENSTRSAALCYDWRLAAEKLMEAMK